MLETMEAEVLFHDPRDAKAGVAALAQHGFVCVQRAWRDPEGPTVFFKCRIVIDRDLYKKIPVDLEDGDDCDPYFDSFLTWVHALVEPLGGDCWETSCLSSIQEEV
jgi:hypothetical protein